MCVMPGLKSELFLETSTKQLHQIACLSSYTVFTELVKQQIQRHIISATYRNESSWLISKSYNPQPSRSRLEHYSVECGVVIGMNNLRKRWLVCGLRMTVIYVGRIQR